MPGESIGALRMVSIIVWMYPSMKTIPASEQIMLPKIWLWFGILRFRH